MFCFFFTKHCVGVSIACAVSSFFLPPSFLSSPLPPPFTPATQARVSNEKQLYFQANKIKYTIANMVSIFALRTNFLTSFLSPFYLPLSLVVKLFFV